LYCCSAISGCVKSYCNQAIRGGRIFCTPGEYDDLTLLDINSLYPAALKNMRLPIGEPKIWKKGTNLKTAFAILTVNIKSIARPRWYYPKLTLGEAVYDNYALHSLIKHCGIKFDVLRGYYWQTGAATGERSDLRDYIDELYAKKQVAEGFERDVLKLMLNAPIGKLLRKGSKTTKKKVFANEAAAMAYATTNQFMVHSVQQHTNTGRWAVVLNWCLDKVFNHAHLGIAALSSARAIMDDLFDECDKLGVKVFYSHTDCLAIDTANVAKLSHRIGPKLGELKIECSGDAVIENCKKYRIGERIRPRAQSD
jgi:hypothetical protein